GFPANKGLIKIGRHQGGQYITKREERLDFDALNEDRTEIEPLLNSVLKTVSNLDHGVACSYDLSPDEHFIVDNLPGKKNIQFVSGLSGHGFKFASVLGETLVAKALNETLDFDLSPFLLSRFNS
ncbi:MAG: FAD-dependent oxidoreductase, partial [Leuconostoc mesenteroides]